MDKSDNITEKHTIERTYYYDMGKTLERIIWKKIIWKKIAKNTTW